MEFPLELAREVLDIYISAVHFTNVLTAPTNRTYHPFNACQRALEMDWTLDSMTPPKHGKVLDRSHFAKSGAIAGRRRGSSAPSENSNVSSQQTPRIDQEDSLGSSTPRNPSGKAKEDTPFPTPFPRDYASPNVQPGRSVIQQFVAHERDGPNLISQQGDDVTPTSYQTPYGKSSVAPPADQIRSQKPRFQIQDAMDLLPEIAGLAHAQIGYGEASKAAVNRAHTGDVLRGTHPLAQLPNYGKAQRMTTAAAPSGFLSKVGLNDPYRKMHHAEETIGSPSGFTPEQQASINNSKSFYRTVPSYEVAQNAANSYDNRPKTPHAEGIIKSPSGFSPEQTAYINNPESFYRTTTSYKAGLEAAQSSSASIRPASRVNGAFEKGRKRTNKPDPLAQYRIDFNQTNAPIPTHGFIAPSGQPHQPKPNNRFAYAQSYSAANKGSSIDDGAALGSQVTSASAADSGKGKQKMPSLVSEEGQALESKPMLPSDSMPKATVQSEHPVWFLPPGLLDEFEPEWASEAMDPKNCPFLED